MTAVKNELKKQRAYLAPEILQKLESQLENRRYDIRVVTTEDWADHALRLDFNSTVVEEDSTTVFYDEDIKSYVHGDVMDGRKQTNAYWFNGYEEDEDYSIAEYPEFDPSEPFVVIIRTKTHMWHKTYGEFGVKFRHTILIYAPAAHVA